ncbi:HypC/HybG/HupF family hydrogenase formation chaperone [Rhodocyclus purpureus]|uniref:HypC/HybG/HupF family hydrogenase formation chaperone n=1 Tax=Rhodocyclus purpureus TaxID=1067 RepID=UPI00237B4265|nr:HypC/HybG/HupF family hydrogenase formation chaperone [Rhodocyclus purpureus]MBK5914898.1 hydrogenase assembly protein HypC [Rhodocyclus purpureus]
MCLAVPMQIIDIDGVDARCRARGVERLVSLFMLQHEAPQVGDWVLVHVGYALQRVDAEEARATWEVFDQLNAGEHPLA